MHFVAVSLPSIPFTAHMAAECAQGFTIETDTLTPTFKLRRPQLLKRYQGSIDRMYEQLDAAGDK
jgi:long-subunit acyl-CoA synthetase (AMP-forming)